MAVLFDLWKWSRAIAVSTTDSVVSSGEVVGVGEKFGGVLQFLRAGSAQWKAPSPRDEFMESKPLVRPHEEMDDEEKFSLCLLRWGSHKTSSPTCEPRRYHHDSANHSRLS